MVRMGSSIGLFLSATERRARVVTGACAAPLRYSPVRGSRRKRRDLDSFYSAGFVLLEEGRAMPMPALAWWQVAHEVVALGGAAGGQGVRAAASLSSSLMLASELGARSLSLAASASAPGRRLSPVAPARSPGAQRMRRARADALAAHQPFARELARQRLRQVPAQAAVGRTARRCCTRGREHRRRARPPRSRRPAARRPRAGGRALDRRDDRLGEGADRVDPVMQALDAFWACTEGSRWRLACSRCSEPPAQNRRLRPR